VNLTTHLRQVPMLRISGAIPHTLPIGFHGIDGDNFASTERKILSVVEDFRFKGCCVHMMPSFGGNVTRK
jgi:hypothetical protein